MARATALFLTAVGLVGLVGATPLGFVVGMTVLAVYAAGFLAETSMAGVWAGLAGGLLGALVDPTLAVSLGVVAAAVIGRTSAALTAGAVGALVVAELGDNVPMLVVGALFAGAQVVRTVGLRVLKTTS
jgi:hypothetical protein